MMSFFPHPTPFALALLASSLVAGAATQRPNIAALMKRHGDAWSFNSNDIVQEGGRLYRHSTFCTLGEYRAWTKANPDTSK